MPSITINFSADHAARMQVALAEAFQTTDENGDPRPATVADLKAYIIADVKQLVRDAELKLARRVVNEPSPVDLT